MTRGDAVMIALAFAVGALGGPALLAALSWLVAVYAALLGGI